MNSTLRTLLRCLRDTAAAALAAAALTAADAQTAEQVQATGELAAPDQTLVSELRERSRYRLAVLPYAVTQYPTDSPANADNRFGFARYSMQLDVRPDVAVDLTRLNLSASPRMESQWQQWEDGPRSGESESETEFFMREWLARIMLREDLFASYGREDLRWGPSYLLSPSNPFHMDNGRENTKLEVPAMDYARAVWVPSRAWTASLIANTGKGRRRMVEEFANSYASKIDYVGPERYASLVLSGTEEEAVQVGSYGGLGLSDAWLAYAEGSLPPSEAARILVGSSYTLARGPTVAVEYYRNGDGCTDNDIVMCFPPFGDASLDDVLIRQNYLLVQIIYTDIRGVLDLTFRWVADLDDKSNRLVTVGEYDLSPYWQVFALGAVDTGDGNDEFGCLVENWAMLGLKFTL